MHILRELTLFVALIASSSYAGTQAATQKDLAIANRVHTIVTGIVSYTRWPQHQTMPKLCIFSSSSFADVLADQSNNFYHSLIVNSVQEALISACDGIYFGKESPQQQLQLIEQYKAQPLLLISEQNVQCTVGSSFCLNITDTQVSFSVNLDSLTRSGVRVSPDVLLLARPRNNNHE